MKKYLKINSFFAYSEKENKMFFSSFDSINIISGKNTSGKSTVFAAILYTFGINDVTLQLNEILESEPLFRLDLSVISDGNEDVVIIVRNGTSLCIKINRDPVKVFNGINANNSGEHIKLKNYLNSFFAFELKLESKGEYKTAPIETMFLPYYISQSTGWIYIRKSFGSLDFYRNFKYDFIDYYLAIENNYNRIAKQEIENTLIRIRNQIKFYEEYEVNDTKIKISKLSDESFIDESKDYVEIYKENRNTRNDCEKKVILISNKISYFKARKNVLHHVKRNIKSQDPKENYCPTCEQLIPFTEDYLYSYLQDTNDTEKELKNLNEQIKKLQSDLNSLESKILETETTIETDYRILESVHKQELTFDTWMSNKANIKIIEEIDSKIRKLEGDEIEQVELLKDYSTEQEIHDARGKMSKKFRSLFKQYLKQLGVKEFQDERFTDLYRATAFPPQGVELHKTILAYNFAFNKICNLNEHIHRFPFMLDAIFNEDIEQENKDIIVEFISKEKPSDTQLFISIAEAKKAELVIDYYNSKYFNNEAKVIAIGGGISERSFYSDYKDEYDDYLDETIELLNTV